MEKRITEEYGYYGFNNKEYHEKTEMLAEDILNFFKYNEKYNNEYQILDNNGNTIVKNTHKIEYSRFCSWLNRIFILITNAPLNNKSLTEPDYIILSNEYIYGKENGKLITIKKEYKIKDNRFEEILCPYIAFKDKVEKATIVISIPDKSKLCDKEELKYILLHELGHIFDAFKKNVDFADMNYDLITQSFFRSGDNIPYDIVEFMRKINNPFINPNNLETIIKSATYQQVSMFFEQNIYYLNDSEMRQHLKNFRYELS